MRRSAARTRGRNIQRRGRLWQLRLHTRQQCVFLHVVRMPALLVRARRSSFRQGLLDATFGRPLSMWSICNRRHFCRGKGTMYETENVRSTGLSRKAGWAVWRRRLGGLSRVGFVGLTLTLSEAEVRFANHRIALRVYKTAKETRW